MYITNIKTYMVFPNGVFRHTLRDPGKQWYGYERVVRVGGNVGTSHSEADISLSVETVPIRVGAIKDL